ncbi:hypothetical protein GCM10025772_13490 [Ferrimonas gelatinilytica]|uniref:Uncharacterized protein n=1 Tax=Ferrimonas gelatinilytica TaxID=1255257 RepID=A0ABP9S0N3_9GAMM
MGLRLTEFQMFSLVIVLLRDSILLYHWHFLVCVYLSERARMQESCSRIPPQPLPLATPP